jgi:diguanylate cyclase (GGDEF)-like protein/putative nucleotidyltransferase with HDIG domain
MKGLKRPLRALNRYSAVAFAALCGVARREFPQPDRYRYLTVVAQNRSDLNLWARLYWLIIVGAGTTLVFTQARHWHSHDFLQFAGCLGVALLASRLRESAPSIVGDIPVQFPLVIMALAEFSLPETVAIACCGTLVQSFRSSKTWWAQLFRVATTAIATVAAAAMLVFLRQRSWLLPVALLTVAITYYMTEVLLASGLRAIARDLKVEVGPRIAPKPLISYQASVAFALTLVWLNRLANWQTSLLVLLAFYFLYRSYLVYMERLAYQRKHSVEVAKLHLRTIEALALAIEAKDQTTHDHLQRVRVYALEVARELRIPAPEVEALQAAALLHDIGKLAVPEHIVSKPGRLTPEEFEKMKIHPLVGAEILERVRFPYPVVPIVRAHHEKWDGTGYPMGLKELEIPIGARILSAVDFVDAMASDRQYRRALPMKEVLERLAQESGKAFDPQVVEVLVRRHTELEQLVHRKVAEVMLAPKLSTDVKIERGIAPAAGFEISTHPARGRAQENTFLASIAAARQEAQTLFEISQDLGASLSLSETLSVFAVKVKRLISYDSIAIYIAKNGKLLPEHVSGDDFRLFASLEIPLGEGLSGWVAQNNKPIINGNPSVEPGYLNDPTKFSTLRSALAVPLEGTVGVVGVLVLYRADKDAFTTDNLRVLQAISSKMALCIENTLKYQQAESSAVTDYLTELPNARSLFLQLDRELARCRRDKSTLTVMVCDMDGFKQINDRFGHLEGNRVLQLFARRLRETCREYDYVARMGGDEFVIVAPGLALEAARNKSVSLSELARQVGHEVCGESILSLSVGQAVYPDDGMDAESLLSEADRRMYATKQRQPRQKNRRMYPRLDCRLTVELQPENGSSMFLGNLANISLNGCYVETPELLPASSRIIVRFSVGDAGLKAIGNIIRSTPGRGVALQFQDAAREEREQLKRILDYVESTSKFYDSQRWYLSRLTQS